ncbi:MAG: hypothetical protein ACYC5K_09140 [Saccharofermentanales bacterium]
MKYVRTKKRLFVIIPLMLVLMAGSFSDAWVSYESFHYVTRQRQVSRVACPAPFLVADIWEGKDLGVPLTMPNDIFITEDGSFYITDTASSSVIIADENKKVRKVLSVFVYEGEDMKFNKPEGVFVTSAGDLYVADTENSRIVQFTRTLEVARIITLKDGDVPGGKFVFYPRKIAVDSAGRVFVAARGQYSGIMQFTPDGRFAAFIGSNLVTATPLELIIKNFMSKEQRDRMKQYIPLEYSNLHIDGDDFIYAVTQAKNESQKIKRLNPGGIDVLLRDQRFAELMKESTIVDICSDENENYYYLDNTDGCVYVNNPDGYLMYAFGGRSDQRGTFRNFSAIAYRNEKLYVADSVNGNITEYAMTGYSRNIKQADREYRQGHYEKSLGIFNDVLKQDANMELAYIYLGRIYYRTGDYKTSMQYFKKAGFRGDDIVGGYSAALAQYRNEKLRENLQVILSAAVLAFIVLMVFYYRKKIRERGREQ